MRFGPSRAERYQRLNQRTKSRRDDLARRYQYAQLFTMVLAVLVELHGEGNLTARRADQAMAHVMVNALRHGAYRAGIKGLSAKFGASEATVKRASKQVRLNGGDPADAMLWRIRGRKGEGVTLWLPSTALVDALWRKHSARKATARDRKAERKAKRVNGSRTHGVKMSHVASLDSEAGQRGSQNPPAVSAASQKKHPQTDESDNLSLAATRKRDLQIALGRTGEECEHGSIPGRCALCRYPTGKPATVP
jgi:hypothetical protein